MKTQYFTATSLDSVISTEDDSRDGLFPFGDVAGTSDPQFIAKIGALAMCSATYEWTLRHAEAVAAFAGRRYRPNCQGPNAWCEFPGASLASIGCRNRASSEQLQKEQEFETCSSYLAALP